MTEFYRHQIVRRRDTGKLYRVLNAYEQRGVVLLDCVSVRGGGGYYEPASMYDHHDEEALIRALRRLCAAIAIAGAARQEAISLAVRMSAASSRVMAEWCVSISPPLDLRTTKL